MSGWLTNGVPLATLPLSSTGLFSVDTQATQGAQPETVAVSLAQLSTVAGGNLPFTTGRFYGLPAGATPGTITPAASTLYAYPLVITGNPVIKTIGIYTSTGQTGGAAHVGLYADNGSGYPGVLIQASDAGAVSATTSTTATANTITLTLSAGTYWLASIFTATGTLPTVADVATGYATSLNSQLGASSVANLIATSGAANTGVSIGSQTYGTLLSLGTSFPTGATLINNAGVPLVVLGT
jgi:hypothetical protein